VGSLRTEPHLDRFEIEPSEVGAFFDSDAVEERGDLRGRV
jgi:hypothetical protein